MSGLKCALACTVAGNQEQRGITRSYLQVAGCGGAARIQLRASAREAVKSLIPRKMETPGLVMHMGAVHVDEEDQRDTHMI